MVRPAALIFACVMLLIACAPDTSARGMKSGQSAPGTRVVTDEVGRQVTIPAEVKRIVTLSPDLTETIYALGLEDRLAGDTDYCDTPPEAKSKPHVGGAQNPSLEAIVALHPNLVLASTSINRRETVEALARLGIAVYTSGPNTVRGMMESVERIAKLTDSGARGAALVERMQSRLDTLHARLEDLPMVHVLFIVWEAPLITIGQNTFIADALRWAGAESVILSKQNWPHVSLEEIVRLQPDYILLSSNHSGPGTGSGASELSELRAQPGWRKLGAVEKGHVVAVDAEMARPSPGLVDAIEKLAHELHPEAFTERAEEGNWFAGNGRWVDPASGAMNWCEQCVR